MRAARAPRSARYSRDEDLNLLPAAASSIGERLDACLEARAFLHADLLADPLEAKSFGITAANAGARPFRPDGPRAASPRAVPSARAPIVASLAFGGSLQRGLQ